MKVPIEGAKVEIYKGGVLIVTGYTDETGRYTYSLDVGEYDIYISKVGYQTIAKHETISTRTQLMVNLPSLTVAVTTDALGVITLVKDYSLGSTDKSCPITLTKYTSLESTDKSVGVSLSYETEVA